MQEGLVSCISGFVVVCFDEFLEFVVECFAVEVLSIAVVVDGTFKSGELKCFEAVSVWSAGEVLGAGADAAVFDLGLVLAAVVGFVVKACFWLACGRDWFWFWCAGRNAFLDSARLVDARACKELFTSASFAVYES